MNELWVMLNAFLPFLFFFAFWFLIGKERGTACSHCGKPFPSFQSPFLKTKRQWMVGGYRCQNCGCETDLAGKKVHASVLPNQQSLIMGLGLIVLILIVVLILSCLPLLMVLNRA